MNVSRQKMFLLAVTACLLVSTAFAQVSRSAPDLVPTGKGWGVAVEHSAGKAKPTGGSNGIFYHGGPVMTAGPRVYYIWYGNWAGNTATTILTDLANSIGGSPYFNINTSYDDGNGGHIANVVTYSGSTTD